MRDILRVVLSTFFCGLVAVPAQAAPLLLTFEGTIPTLSKRITIFTATQAGTVDTTTTDNLPCHGGTGPASSDAPWEPISPRNSRARWMTRGRALRRIPESSCQRCAMSLEERKY